MTPSQARNAIKRALYGVLDRYPGKAKIDQLWAFFESRCAYCGRVLDRTKRDGHVDHLVSVAVGGSNHISNFVLACGECNGDHKRDIGWEMHLAEVNPVAEDLIVRRNKILNWISRHGGNVPQLNPRLAELVEQQVAAALTAFNDAQEAIQQLRPPSGE